MPWKCRLVDPDKQPKEIGDMWPGDEPLPIANEPGHFFEMHAGWLSEEYVRERMATRRPILVMLPNREIFCVDAAISGKWRGWQVTGEIPNITLSPSINCVGRWHGFLRDGVLSDDVEGRTFDN